MRLALRLTVLAIFLAPVAALAQGGGLADVMALQDSLSTTAPDSAALDQTAPATERVAPVIPWWRPFVPTVDGRVQSSVSSVVLTGGIEAPLADLVPGMRGRARYSRTDTDYRQNDRSVEATTFNFDAVADPTPFGDFDLSLFRNTSYDENRGRNPIPGTPALINEYDLRELHAELTGQRDLGSGLRAIWGVRGDIEDVERNERGVPNDRSLAGAAVGGGWGTRGPWHDFVARYGYERSGGERTLRDQTGDASTELDTLRARGQIDFGQRFNIDIDARRTTFVEDRLDFLRNENGIVDTLGVANPVGDEHESSWANSIDMDLRSRPLPRLALNAGASSSYRETNLTLSKAETVQLSNEQLNAEAVIRYSEAGSLRVNVRFTDQYNDRRTRGSNTFRGKETRVSKLAEAEVRHRLTDMIEFHLDLQQTLDQNINESPDNPNDRDRLNTRSDLKLISDPWEWFQVEVAGAYVYTEEINIDAERVNANQNTDLYEVRSNLILDPEGGWRFVQNYRLQIRIIDRIVGIADDRFNKQGQFDTRAEYGFGSGVFVDGQYIVDYRRNGDRDPSRPDEEVYIYSGARRDHRVSLGIRVPLPLVELRVRTERGFLRDNSRTIPVSQDRGRIDAGFRGNWNFWKGRGTLSADANRVMQFGPLVRAETEEYWDMNASIRVSF